MSAEHTTLSRRGVLTASAVVATATAAGAGAAAGAPASAAATEVDGPVVVHVRDLASGTLDVFAGSTHKQIRDRDLAARLAHL
jgi:nitrous oxide reductase